MYQTTLLNVVIAATLCTILQARFIYFPRTLKEFHYEGRKTSYHEAKSACAAINAQLLTIKHARWQELELYQDNAFWHAHNVMGSVELWMGAERIIDSDEATSNHTNAKYRWTDGPIIEKYHWDIGYPRCTASCCAIYLFIRAWHDAPCESQHSYICENPLPQLPESDEEGKR